MICQSLCSGRLPEGNTVILKRKHGEREGKPETFVSRSIEYFRGDWNEDLKKNEEPNPLSPKTCRFPTKIQQSVGL